ncbi:CBN-RFC-1 protein, partial [Aphelenchoides avenae]
LLEHVRVLRKAADSIVLGDVIDKQIRTGGSWNLLCDQAMMSCAIPCLYLDGHMTDQLRFPSWLGRNATAGKRQRLMRQLAISGSSHALVTDYIPVLRDRMHRPLATRENDGVPEVVALYKEYDLLRDDMEAIDELGVWPQFPDIAKSINRKTKAAVKRTLNKESRMLPYALEEPIKSRRKAETAGGGELELDEEGHVVENVIGVDDDEVVAGPEDEPSSGVDMIENLRRRRVALWLGDVEDDVGSD